MTATLVHAVLIGAGATMCIDLWALVLARGCGIRSMNYCLLGRWVLHMPSGRFVHENIARSEARPHECHAGWSVHYGIGIAFAAAFLMIAPNGWLSAPSLKPALTFGVATVAVPFLTVQPGFGLGLASSKSPNPWHSRLKSAVTHSVFGLGLYAAAVALHAVQ